METHPVVPPEIWDQTPPEVQAYIRVLEARVETIVSMVHRAIRHSTDGQVTLRVIDVAAVEEVGVLKPTPCTHCQAPFAGDDPKPWRPQVIALPPIPPVVTAYQGHQRACPAGGAITRAPWPAGVPSGTYGPRGPATVALYTGADRWSQRPTQPAMVEVCGIPMRVGTISQREQATTEAVAAPMEEARTYVHAPAVAHLDETSGRPGAKRAW